MQGKPLNIHRIRLAQAATGMSPADYPLGSLESRSAVRALLDHLERTKPRLSEYESDALTIYRFAAYFLAGYGWKAGSLLLREVEASIVYQNGLELAKRQPASDTRVAPVACLEEVFDRRGIELPRDAKWREPLMWCGVHAALLRDFQEAWERQLGHMPFPIKTEINDDWGDAKLYLRNSAEDWQEETDDRKCRRILGPVKELNQLLTAEEIGN